MDKPKSGNPLQIFLCVVCCVFRLGRAVKKKKEKEKQEAVPPQPHPTVQQWRTQHLIQQPKPIQQQQHQYQQVYMMDNIILLVIIKIKKKGKKRKDGKYMIDIVKYVG